MSEDNDTNLSEVEKAMQSIEDTIETAQMYKDKMRRSHEYTRYLKNKIAQCRRAQDKATSMSMEMHYKDETATTIREIKNDRDTRAWDYGDCCPGNFIVGKESAIKISQILIEQLEKELKDEDAKMFSILEYIKLNTIQKCSEVKQTVKDLFDKLKNTDKK